jgi:hypothetical protein
MNDTVITWSIVGLALFKTIIDVMNDYKLCIHQHPEMIIVLLIHALMWVFSLFGWLYKDKRRIALYLIFSLCLLLHWMFNEGKCTLTTYTNTRCEFKEDRGYENPNQSSMINTLLFLIRITGLFVAIYKLNN